MDHRNKELLCYIWQMIAGPIHYYLDDPLLLYWFPHSDNFYTQAHNFIQTHKPGHHRDYQTTFIPWVQSIVIKHYVLGKEVLFWGQDDYVGHYRFLNDFIALYLTFSLGHTIGNKISQWPPNAPYSESNCHNPIVFIHSEHADWDPTDKL
jgi:hypothetical protein